MVTRYPGGTLALALGIAASPVVASQDHLGVLPQGRYVCALPGNAAGAAWNEEPAANFSILGASSYRAAAGNAGTYLLVDRRLEFTRGPLKGRKFLILSSGLLQEVGSDGKLGRLRCHRAGPAD